ncbi:MAG: dodecin domain-containing protein [Desulfuromonadales bacterium]|nr:dodecin domain-containing protein [Desulfuromonadales bacterium]
MSIAKVIEIHVEGSSIEEAAAAALGEAAKTVDQIRSLYIEDIQAIVENNKIAKYRLNTKVTFVIKN